MNTVNFMINSKSKNKDDKKKEVLTKEDFITALKKASKKKPLREKGKKRT